MPGFRLRPSPRVGTAALVLLCAALCAGVIAWRARAASDANRAAVQRLMQDHAGYAASEFTRRADDALESAAATLQLAADRLGGASPLGPEAFGDSVRALDAGCGCLSAAHGFFTLDLTSGALAAEPAPPRPQAERWLRDEIGANAGWLRKHPAGDSAAVGHAGLQRSWIRLRTVDDRPELLVFTVVLDAQKRPRAVYGLLADAKPITTRVFQRVMRQVPLLPPSVMRGAANDSLVRVSVLGPDRTPLWSSAAPGWSEAQAEEPFPAAASGLITQVEVLPAAVPWLLHGEIPSSSQPLMLALLALTVTVLAVAVLQIRRQRSLDRMRADFVSGVSHELRTPITQIRLFTELLLGGRLRTDEERQHSLRLIERETRRLTFLVERILDFNRSERGALRVHRGVTDAQPILREALDGFEPVARARGMVVRATLEPELVAPLDPYALRHVLLNFLENAVKYGPPGQVIWVGAERRDAAIRLWVEDAGPGVPADERGRIWEPYYRLDRPVDRVVGGSGIGLSLVRDLVGGHEGRTWVEDGERRGARFVAEFPGTWDGDDRARDAAPSIEDA